MKIGVSDNEVAPYGIATNEYLVNSNQYDGLKNKLVMGESISQVNLYISTGAVHAGFTSYSFKTKHPTAYKYFEIDPHLFSTINQGVILLNKENSKDSQQFINFLVTDQCKSVLNYFSKFTMGIRGCSCLSPHPLSKQSDLA